ncbi:hypothetical protein LZ575_16430 [Antarcticibacterium sp. 1MA-6-2]|uniref:helix-turn-helix transcriptional regulator n=1 Tax=Antarcticibacterium sp. 1MA-6-2 TaxID=2908210 RepID=UPI001F48C60D|nr:hypothetical protein [Antarcticibacterium sp. 1MA-6-2]UJH90406.1 hypothetical protein LZ575_16430 [Antarcticibacterium sp. 1MA-6-2]
MDLLKAENENEKLKQRNLLSELIYRKEELTNNTLRNVHKNNLLAIIKEALKKEINRDPNLKNNLKEIIENIDDSLSLDKDWEAFYHLFGQVHPTFIEDLKISCSKLSDRDIKLCALIKLNFSSQHIATLFGISLSSVKVARHRLRKKLDIPEDVSFDDFLEKKILDRSVTN